MSLSNGATKRPASDLTSFDISQHSPEQIARLFARWKEQRRRVEHAKEAAPVGARSPRIMPRLGSNSPEAEAPHSEPIEHRDSQSHPLNYSADFAAILGDGDGSAAGQRTKSLKFPPSRASVARSRLRWSLAGAASVIAVTAVAGTVHWPERSGHHRQMTASTAEPLHAEPSIQPVPEVQTALPFLPALTRWTGAEASQQQQLADLARWQSPGEMAKVPLLPMLKPDAPVIQTAGNGMAAVGLASGSEAALGPARITAVSLESLATLTGETALEADVEEAGPPRTMPVPSGLDPRGKDRPDSSNRSGASVAGLHGDRPAPAQASGSVGSNDPGTDGAANDGADGGMSPGGSTGGSGTGSNGDGGSSSSGSDGSNDGGGGSGSGSGNGAGRSSGSDGSGGGGSSGGSGFDAGSSGGGSSSSDSSGGGSSGGGSSDGGGLGGGGEGGEGGGAGDDGGDGGEGGEGSGGEGGEGDGGGEGGEGGGNGGEGGESGEGGGDGGEGGGGEGGEGGGNGGEGGGEGGEGGRGGGDD